MASCEYEELRRRNLEDNKRILAELGLSNPFGLQPKVIKKGIKRPANDNYEPKKKRSKLISAPVDLEGAGSIRGTRRLSARLRKQEPGTECIGEDNNVEENHEKNRVKYVMPDRPNWYGEVPGVAVGTLWMTRMDCCHDGIHRPPVAGIHGGPDGAYSLALSGGYEDDIDLGDCFTYTGEGGRDLRGTKNCPKNLRTAPQSKDQELTRGNLALSQSVESGNPVRVIRGYKLKSPFAPDEGYRYDGLYTVEKFWFTKGLSGHGVYKFALRRCQNQPLPPWELANDPMSPSKSSDSGFSDATSDSNEGKKSDACDSDISSTIDENSIISTVSDKAVTSAMDESKHVFPAIDESKATFAVSEDKVSSAISGNTADSAIDKDSIVSTSNANTATSATDKDSIVSASDANTAASAVNKDGIVHASDENNAVCVINESTVTSAIDESIVTSTAIDPDSAVQNCNSSKESVDQSADNRDATPINGSSN